MKLNNPVLSNNKKNIQHVALGTFQIEFFQLENIPYFAVYRFNIEASRCTYFDISGIQVSTNIKNGFQISKGNKSYKFEFKRIKKGLQLIITQYLWGWLPLQNFKGLVSKAGVSTIQNVFGVSIPNAS